MTDQPNLDSVEPDAPLADRLAALIQNISAYIEHYHGGSVTLEAFDGKTAYVRLGGACDGCPLSAMTLRGWVQGTVQQFFPEVRVEEVPGG
jgi:Fe-S cluster biogenesis protein NfuA